MKKIIIALTIIFTLSVAGGLGAAILWKTNSKPVSSSDEVKRFVITRGSSAEKVAQDLYDSGLIRSPLAFKFYTQLKGESGRIQAGEYDLSPSLSLVEVIDKLKGGPDELWVTIPEGLRREEIPDIFIDVLGLTRQQAQVLRSDFLEASIDKEGFLFPDTYLVPRDISGRQAVIMMENNFERKISEIGLDNNSLNILIIKASLIEREAKSDDERPVIAGIIDNRLALGMPLQIDATAQYAIATQRCNESVSNCKWWAVPSRNDLRVDSPYNTYLFSTLPPTPISNPGLSSIKAAANPEETDYLYYLHDSEGNIHYAQTLEEHNINVAEYIN